MRNWVWFRDGGGEGLGGERWGSSRGLAAVPVGDGGAWPGFETTHQACAAGVESAGGTGGHGRASRRGAERSAALASRAAGPSGAQNTSGTTRNNSRKATAHGHTKQPGPTEQDARRPEHQRHHTETTRGVDGNQTQHSTGARARRPAPLDATTQTLRSTCVPFRSAHAAHRSRRSSRSPRLRRRAGPRR